MDATWAMSSLSSILMASRSISATAFSTARSMPRLTSIGLAPAATFFKPSSIMAWASTVAVVVPSPATSLVLDATSRHSCAPMFSFGSFSSTSLATVTPSFVIRGSAELPLQDDVAAPGPERHLDGVGHRVDAALQRLSRLGIKSNLLCSHRYNSLLDKKPLSIVGSLRVCFSSW